MERKVYVSYSGRCPTCGEPQSGKSEHVDADCGICESKRESKRIHDTQYKYLEGAEIRGITGYDNNGMPSMMTIITDKYVYDITFEKININHIWKNTWSK